MINKLNLSSNPFRNRTLPWVFSAIILFISLVVAVFTYANYASVRSDLDLVKKHTQSVEAELKKYQEQEERISQQLSPEQQQMLVASHKLVLRKQFSWSRLFTDLENLLPGGVSVSQLNVIDVERRNERTEAEIEFGVLSFEYNNVVRMIDRMNSSGLFRAEMRGQALQKSESGRDYTEYTLRLIYTPHYYSTPEAPAATDSVSNMSPEVKH